MSFKDRAGRSELLHIVQQQEEKIKRYESRLHDLVIAYRTVLKEKTTLEETVKATSASPSTSRDDDASRFEVLTQSLATLTEDKQRMEASYQADRRRLIQEHETLLQTLKQELDSAEIVRRELQRENGELKQKARELKLQAERVDADQAHMLREMQGLLAKERGMREQLEFEIDELRERSATFSALPNPPPPPPSAKQPVERSEMEDYQRRIRDLSNEVEQLRGRQSATEGPIENLREELVAVKAEHRVQLQRELQRANEAERRLADFTEQHEERVSSLEARLTELSQTLGSYERTRESDQAAIAKLRERVTQLDMENSALSRGREVSPANDALEEDEEVMILVEKVKQANARASRPVDLTAAFQLHDSEENLHRRCRDELDQLKEEFERYKLKAQSVLLKQSALSSSSADLVSRDQVDRLQQQTTRLKERCRQLQEELVNAERVNKRCQTSLRHALDESETRHAEELESARRSAEKRVERLDDELKRHRNRTIALLAEKEEEMKTLRMAMGSGSGGAGAAQNSLVAASVSALLREDGVGPAISSCTIIHCQQERARLEGEIRCLRESKRSLEASEREWTVEKKEMEEKIGYLERMTKLRGSVGRGSAKDRFEMQASNLEYLKNVVLNYMTSRDADGRRSMLKAIGTVLQFSPKEMKKVDQLNISGWFY